MIKPNELKIDNLVSTINRDGEVHLPNEETLKIVGLGISQVELIKPKEILAEVETTIKVPYSDLVPLKLTEERLLAFGFQKGEIGLWRHEHHINFHLQEFYIEEYLDGYIFKYGGFAMNRVINKVHILQNAFWFTGTELEIDGYKVYSIDE